MSTPSGDQMGIVARLRGNPWVALSVLSLGLFMTLLDITIVNVAIPQMVDGLHASLDEALWVVNAYTLVLAVLLITAGRLGDIFGPRALFMVGTGLFTVASATCGLSGSAGVLIAARGVQGLGAALLTPQSLTIVLSLFPPERRGSAFAVNGIVAGVAAMAGPLVGGLLVTQLNWRWIFYVNVPVGVLSIGLTLLLVPDLRPGRRHRLDLTGVALASAGLLAVTFGLVEGQRYGWSEITGVVSIPAVLALGIVLLVGFGVQQRRAQRGEPLVPFALFRDRNFTLMTVVGAALQFAMIGLFLPFTIYLQSVLGLSALAAGLVTAPSAGVSMLTAPVVGRFVDRHGGRGVLVFGLSVFALGVGLIDLAATTGASRTSFLPGILVAGLGTGSIFAPMIANAMARIPPRLAGAASGTLNTTRQLGSVLGGALVGALLQNRLAAGLHAQAVARAGQLPPAVRHYFVHGFSHAGSSGLQVGAGQASAHVPSGLPPAVAHILARVGGEVFRHGYVSALRPTLVLSVAVLVLAALCALGSRSTKPPRRAPAPPGADARGDYSSTAGVADTAPAGRPRL